MVVGQPKVLRPKTIAFHVGTDHVACGEDGCHLFPICRYGTGSKSRVGIHSRHYVWRTSNTVGFHRPFQLARPHVEAIEFASLLVGTCDEDILSGDDGRIISMLGYR